MDASGIATLLTIGAVTAIGGVLLNLILGLSRVIIALARDGDLPRSAGRISAGRPAAAIAIVGIGVACIAIMGSVQVAWTTSAAAVLAYYGITNLASFVTARRDRSVSGMGIGAAGCLGCIILGVTLPTSAWIIPLGVAATGVLVAWIVRREERHFGS